MNRQKQVKRLVKKVPNLQTTREAWRWAAMLIGVAGLGLLLWWQVGLQMTVTTEGWIFYRDYMQGQLHPGLADRNRVGFNLPYLPGYLLTPNSFVGLNVLFVVIFLGKGIVTYALLRKLAPHMAGFALATALLVMIYPFDEGIFYLRLAPYQLHTLLFLVATYLFLLYYEQPHLGLAVAISLLQILTLTILEVAYLAFALAPVALIWLERSISWRVVRVTLAWYVVPLVMGLYLVYSLRNSQLPYQASLLSTPAADLSSQVMMETFMRVYRRGFVEGWMEAARLLREPSNLWLMLAVAASAFMLIATQSQAGAGHQRKRAYLGLLLFGLVFVGVTFLPFLPTGHRYLNDRVFIMPSIGATLVILGAGALATELLFWDDQWRRYAFAAGAAFLIGLASIWALERHAFVYNISQVEQQLLSQTAQTVPAVANGTYIVLFGSDDLLSFNNELMLSFSVHVPANRTSPAYVSAMRWVYEDPHLQARHCFIDHSACKLTTEGLQNAGDVLPYERIVGIYFEDGQLTVMDDLPTRHDDAAYDPWALIDTEAPVPPQAFTALPKG